MTDYQKIIETAHLILAADENSSSLGDQLGVALAALSREELIMVTMAQKLMSRGGYTVSTDNPAGWEECRKLAEYMGAIVTDGGDRPWFLPDDIEGQHTIRFRMPPES